MVFSFEFEQICPPELPEKTVPWLFVLCGMENKKDGRNYHRMWNFKSQVATEVQRLASAITPIDRKKNLTSLPISAPPRKEHCNAVAASAGATLI
jgi:hypothetical protein